LFRRSGGNQAGQVATTLPIALTTVAQDKYGNVVPGVVVNYTDTGAGGKFSANTVTTDSKGLAPSNYTTPTTAGILKKVYATASGLNNLNYVETAVAGPATTIAPNSGNGQNGSPNTQLPQALVAKVTDQYGNPVSGNSVTFSDGGAGGTFSANPVSTTSTGLASVSYTTSGNVGSVTVQAAATGVSATASFTVKVQ
jgi:adhesin/invasin